MLVNVCALTLFVLFVFAQPLKRMANGFSRGVYSGMAPTSTDTARNVDGRLSSDD